MKQARLKQFFSVKAIVMLLSLIFLAALLAYASFERQDEAGNAIHRDIIAPGGGGTWSDSASNLITGSIGQPATGISTTESGNILFSGVHGPLFISTGSMGWMSY
ncbi:hypothetical protein JW926_01650 [Candidatus Sumerlaeota bacterium]|nr:hypothetical protein [Candidatus Sumerlaeota bacterium]